VAARTWLAVVLCCLVWFVYTKWFAPPMPNPSTPAVESPANNATGDQLTASTGLFAAPLHLAQGDKFETPKFEAVLSPVGGKIESWHLNQFREAVRIDSPPIAMVSPSQSEYSLATLFTDSSLSSLGGAKYDAKSLDSGVVMETRQAGGVHVKKTFRVEDGSYVMDSDLELEFPANSKRDWGYLIVPLGAKEAKFDTHNPLSAWEVVYLQNDSVTRKPTQKIDAGEKVVQGNTSWLAFGNRYFSTAVANRSEINPDVVLYNDKNFIGGYLRYPVVLKEGQSSLKFSFRTFAGPKDPAELSHVPGLKQLIDYGMFTVLAYPLLGILKFFYGYFRNYGVAIILLTLLVRIAFYPLSIKSFRSMKAMQKLQPQIQALKEKYGDDREKFSREQMALFKTHKVNPAGGCLPMFVQLPVFIALYAVLGNSIDLFHAPFFGWIQDLSAKDPLYIFPVLMGVSMLLQQRITPNVGMDPMQAKMMYFMPIFFTFLMVNLPSGLTVYMFVSTLVGILQQYILSRERRNEAAAVVAASSARAPEKG
jgi:YidC/Oxa1 family membrane protein insertase